MYEIDKLETIFIGYQGENETRTIAIDVSSWVEEFPQGHIAILHSRPTEQNPYIVANATVNNGILEWVVNGADVGIAGMGYAVIQMSYNEQVLKTAVFTTKIGKTLDGTISPTPTPPAPSWVTDILNSRAEQFTINEQGHLIVTKVDGTTEDLGQVVGGGSSAVTSVNNKTGDVFLNALDVSAVPQVTGEFLYNGGEKLPEPWRDIYVQCISDYFDEYDLGFYAGYFYYIDEDGDKTDSPVLVQPNPQIPEEIQKTSDWLGENRGDPRYIGKIYQCLDTANDYIQGYWYLGTANGWQQINVQPTSGGGTSDYSDLTNKPKINNVELSGNKTTSDLGLFSGDYPDLSNKPTIPSKTSDLQNDSGFIDNAANNLSNYYDKNAVDNKLANKQNVIDNNNKLPYTLLSDTPTIPTVPTNVSSFNNDAGYLTLATLPIYDGGVQ